MNSRSLTMRNISSRKRGCIDLKDAETAQQVFVANWSRQNVAAILAACLAFAFAGIFMTGWLAPAFGLSSPAIFEQAFGLLMIALFGGYGVKYARGLFDLGPAISIGEDGIEDRLHCNQRIPWEAIDRLFIYQKRNWPFPPTRLISYALNPEFDLKPNLWHRWILGLNRFFGMSYFLQDLMTDQYMEDMIQAIEQFAPDHLLPL